MNILTLPGTGYFIGAHDVGAEEDTTEITFLTKYFYTESVQYLSLVSAGLNRLSLIESVPLFCPLRVVTWWIVYLQSVQYAMEVPSTSHVEDQCPCTFITSST